MKKIHTAILLVCIILVSSIGFTNAKADQMLNPAVVHAIVSNPVSIYGKTYPLQVENKTYNVYYGFNLTYATATNISIAPENKTMQINLKEVTTTDAMWINFPQDLISAENNNFVLYVDGQEKKYELATSGHSIVMGFMVPANVKLVEIQGTRAIPEFPEFATTIIMASFMFIIILHARMRI